MKQVEKYCLGIALMLVLSTTLWGQGHGANQWHDHGSSGARLPGAEITATQTATGTVRSVIGNETGSYSLRSLAIGPYKLEVMLPGFRTFSQTGITLEVNASPVMNVTMEVGQVNQTVEVQANTALVETRSVGVGQVMETRQILDLPLNGRSVTELIALSGAAVVPNDGSSSRAVSGQQNIRVAGGLSGSVRYSLDSSHAHESL
jgi:hypothetical protein